MIPIRYLESREKEAKWKKRIDTLNRAYPEKLRKDRNFTHFQTLAMEQPLAVESVHVPLKLWKQQENNPVHELDPALLAVQAQHDPKAILQMQLDLLKSRDADSQDPDELKSSSKPNRFIIVGNVGSGKTFLLKHLAIETLRTLHSAHSEVPGPGLPISIDLHEVAKFGNKDLRDFAKFSKSGLLDFAAHLWNCLYTIPEDEARTFIENALHKGKVLLLLDGLDQSQKPLLGWRNTIHHHLLLLPLVKQTITNEHVYKVLPN